MTHPGHGILLLLLLAALPLSGCAAAAASGPVAPELAPSPVAPPPGLRIAFTELYGGNVALWTAQAAGLFAKHELDVSIAQQRPHAALEALAARELDVVVGNAAPALLAAAAGAELRVVAGLVNHLPHRLMVAASIESPDDLRGARLGVGLPGSASESSVRFALREWQLEPGADVVLLQIGSAHERLAALENGAVQGAAVAPPETLLLERLGFLTLLDLAPLWLEDPTNQVIVAASLVQEEPVVVQRLVNALLEGTALAKRDRELGRRVLREYLQIADDAVLDETYDLFVQKLAPRAPYPAAAAVRRLIRTLGESAPAVAALDPAAIVERRFVQQAVEVGYLGRLYGAN